MKISVVSIDSVTYESTINTYRCECFDAVSLVRVLSDQDSKIQGEPVHYLLLWWIETSPGKAVFAARQLGADLMVTGFCAVYPDLKINDTYVKASGVL